MTASRILKQNGGTVVAVSQGESFQSVVEVLARNRVGAVIVLGTRHELAGIISERDVVQALAANHGDCAKLTAEDIMSRGVQTCSPDDFESDLMTRMSEAHIGHLPVVTGGRVIGMVSMRDVLALRLQKIHMLWRAIETEAAEAARGSPLS